MSTQVYFNTLEDNLPKDRYTWAKHYKKYLFEDEEWLMGEMSREYYREKYFDLMPPEIWGIVDSYTLPRVGYWVRLYNEWGDKREVLFDDEGIMTTEMDEVLKYPPLNYFVEPLE